MSGRASASASSSVVLLPDAGPLITLAYANSLELLFKPGWAVRLVDMVLHEVTRNATPTSHLIADWARRHAVQVLKTRTFEHYQHAATTASQMPRKANLGELAIQEVMGSLALTAPPMQGVFLFEDHKISRASFLLPEHCRKVSTRAYLIFLEQQRFIPSASEVQAQALRAGRAFSQLRFPPETSATD